jgi:(p)ppGpp synthase/HD superfamily hydrolase
MIYTLQIQRAIRFSTKTHEVYQKQKRKGKDIPYITHPLTVGLILARAGASEDVVIAGILHDTIEDSTPEKKVSREMLVERFGANVAALVESVTETRKDLPWEERKSEALDHIQRFSNDSLLVKSADIIANASELLEDYKQDGEEVFERFNTPKDKILRHYKRVMAAILKNWPDSPLTPDLAEIDAQIDNIGR